MVHAHQINGNPLAAYIPVDTTPADRHELAELQAEIERLKTELRGAGRVFDRQEAEITLLRGQLADNRASVRAITTVLLDTLWLEDALATTPAYADALCISAGRVLGDRMLARLSEICEATK